MISFLTDTSANFFVFHCPNIRYDALLFKIIKRYFFLLFLAQKSSLLLKYFSKDTWYNPDEFPRSFIKGSAEGFWWAFVTMTTVG